jgi:hypothetical protein
MAIDERKSSATETQAPKRGADGERTGSEAVRRGEIVNDAERVSQDPADDQFLGPPEVVPSPGSDR